MTLQKRIVPLEFTAGIETKADPKSAALGAKLLTLENATFVSPGRIRKRNGYAATTQFPLSYGTARAGAALMTRGSEIVGSDGHVLYSYSPNTASAPWSTRGYMTSPVMAAGAAVTDNNTINGYDSAINGRRQLVAYESAASASAAATVRWVLVDIDTGGIIATGSVGANNVYCPKVLPVDLGFLVLYLPSAGSINVKSTTVSLAGATSNVNSTMNTQGSSIGFVSTFDATVFAGYVYLLYSYSFAPLLGVTCERYTTATPTVSTSSTGTIGVSGGTSTGGLCVCGEPSTGNVLLGWITPATASGIQAQIMSGDLQSTKMAATNIDTGLASSQGLTRNMSVCADTVNGYPTFRFFYSWMYGGTPGAVGQDYVRTNTLKNNLDTTYSVGTPSYFAWNVSVCGKPFAVPISAGSTTSQIVVPVALDAAGNGVITSPQATWFLADGGTYNKGQIIAKAYAGTAGGRYTNGLSTTANPGAGGILPESPVSGSIGYLTCRVARQLVAQVQSVTTTTFAPIYGLQQIAVNFADTTNAWGRCQLGGSLFVGSGVSESYDGLTASEHNFLMYPNMTVPPVVTAFGTLGDGVYKVCCCFEWMDANGNLHRSAPSNIQTVTVDHTKVANGVSGFCGLTLSLPWPVMITQKPGIRVTYYVTDTNGSVFYQANNLTSVDVGGLPLGVTPSTSYGYEVMPFPLWTQTATQLQIPVNYAGSGPPTTSTTDTAGAVAGGSHVITGNPTLYTTGGVLSNYAPPAMLSPVVHHNRIIGIDQLNRLSLVYSQQAVPGTAVAFSPYLTLNVDPRGGDCTALASLDDNLIVFKADRVFVITGQGPDATGGQSDWSDSTVVTSDAGCVAPKSVVVMPNGVMFKSAKGIYLLDRSLRLSYIGAPVEAYNSLSITSAALVANTNQVRFTLSSGQSLVYDYLMEQWSVFTNAGLLLPTSSGTPLSADAVIDSTGTYRMLFSQGSMLTETPGTFSDAGAFISMKAVTSWLQFAGVQGFQRAYKLLLLGEFDTPHTLNVAVAYDFASSIVQADAITPSTTNPEQWRIFLARQKCEAIQLTIYDAAGTGQEILPPFPFVTSAGWQASYGEGFNLSALSFEVGVKRGAYKLPATASVG